MAVSLSSGRFGHCPWTLQNKQLALPKMIRVFATDGELQGAQTAVAARVPLMGKFRSRSSNKSWAAGCLREDRSARKCYS